VEISIREDAASVKITASFDPVSRIEGHLGVEVEFDTVNGIQQVVNARAGGLLFRGFENILIGRDPRDAPLITQRICGVCPVAHGMAAVKALDSACGVTVPANARIMRSLVNAANFIESHILHFYLLVLPDFIAGPAMPPWQADWSIDRRFDPRATEALMAGYLKAIEIRRKAHEMGALFGGKMPHAPAYVPGGFTANPRLERIRDFRAYLDELIAFIRDRYMPDAESLASQYSDYFAIGRGGGNLLAYGAFDLDDTGTRKLFAGGQVLDGSPSPQPVDAASITEHVTYSWYQAKTNGLNPASGKTTAVDPASKNNAYSWLKAPRYGGKPYEVGPLARMWINGEYTHGISVMDRHLARAKEALKIAQAARNWLEELVPEGPVYNPPIIPASASSVGLTEAPRGALGHWLAISGGTIANYQVITPTTWNASPRDSKGVLGPMEEALLGTPVADTDKPVEVMRVIHSFDPCLDCAVH
jgi:hydrogenase large subunit